MAEAIKAWHGDVAEVQQEAETTFILAERRIGQELKNQPKATGTEVRRYHETYRTWADPGGLN